MSREKFECAAIVLGMHRSGTSALAGLLGKCGLTMPATLLAPGAANERGFWESERIKQLNDAALAKMGLNWRSLDPVRTNLRTDRKFGPDRQQAEQILIDEFAEMSIPVIKDPRLCRTFPLWEGALKQAARRHVFALIHRNPLEVAQSLRRRDLIDPAIGLTLWARHCLDSEASSRGKSRQFVSYARLLDDPRATIATLGSALGLPLDGLDKAGGVLDQYIDQSLRHHVGHEAELADIVARMPIIGDVHEVLTGWSDGRPERPEEHRRLDEARSALDRLGAIPDALSQRVRIEQKGRLAAEHKASEASERSDQAWRTLDDLGSSIERWQRTSATAAAEHSQRLAETTDQLRSLTTAHAARDEHAQVIYRTTIDQGERLAEAAEQVRQLSASLTTGEERSDARHREAIALQRSVAHDLDQSLTTAIGRLSVVLRDHAVVEAKLTDALTRVANLEGDVARATVDRNIATYEHRDVVARLEERLRITNAELERLTEAYRSDELARQHQLQRAQDDAQRHATTIADLEAQLAAITLESTEAQAKAKTLTTKYRAAKEELERDRKRLSKAAKELGATKASLSQLQSTWAVKLQTRLSHARQSLARIAPRAGSPYRARAIRLIGESSLFDRQWYLAKYRDVAASGADPASHYFDHGWREGRDPGPDFSTNAYLRANADVAAHNVNPLLHCIEFGLTEGRTTSASKAPPPKRPTPAEMFGPAAPCLAVPIDRALPYWPRSSALLGSNPSDLAIDGYWLGTCADRQARDALVAVITLLAGLSGSGGDNGELAARPDSNGIGLVDAWHAGQGIFRTRWQRAGDERPLVVRVLAWTGDRVTLVGDGLIRDRLDLIEARPPNPYFPLLFLFADLDGRVTGSELLAFPSLCRGGFHYTETVVRAERDNRPVDPAGIGAILVESLIAGRGADSPLIDRILVDLSGADGAHPLFQPDLREWLRQVMRIGVEPINAKLALSHLASAVALPNHDDRAAARYSLVLGSDMVPAITALVALDDAADEASAGQTLSFVAGRDEDSMTLVRAPATGLKQPPSDYMPAYPRILSGGLSSATAPNIALWAIRTPAHRSHDDAELLVPVLDHDPAEAPGTAPPTWIIRPDQWDAAALRQSLAALAVQQGGARPRILFIGSPDAELAATATALFGDGVDRVDEAADAAQAVKTDLVGFLGANVVLHDRRTTAVLAAALADVDVASASAVIVSISKRGGGWVVAPADAGALDGGEDDRSDEARAQDALLLWRTAWPSRRPPRDLWLTRTAALADWTGAAAANGDGNHVVTAEVTASYAAAPHEAAPAMVAPPGNAKTVLTSRRVIG